MTIAKHSNITSADKRLIVSAVAACTKPAEIGIFMRREGVYSSALAAWRRKYVADELHGAEAKKRGPRSAPARDQLKQLELVTRDRYQLLEQLSNSHLVIEIQKKLPYCWSKFSHSRRLRVLDCWHA